MDKSRYIVVADIVFDTNFNLFKARGLSDQVFYGTLAVLLLIAPGVFSVLRYVFDLKLVCEVFGLCSVATKPLYFFAGIAAWILAWLTHGSVRKKTGEPRWAASLTLSDRPRLVDALFLLWGLAIFGLIYASVNLPAVSIAATVALLVFPVGLAGKGADP
jgi:uncharacterized membrane protein YuzA (DUF378 family)